MTVAVSDLSEATIKIIKTTYDAGPSILGGAIISGLVVHALPNLELNPISSAKFTALLSLILVAGKEFTERMDYEDDEKVSKTKQRLCRWTFLSTLGLLVSYQIYDSEKNDLLATLKVVGLAIVTFGSCFGLQYFLTKSSATQATQLEPRDSTSPKNKSS